MLDRLERWNPVATPVTVAEGEIPQVRVGAPR